MPKGLEKKLKKKAKILFPKNKKKQDVYVYGTLKKIDKRKRKDITRQTELF